MRAGLRHALGIDRDESFRAADRAFATTDVWISDTSVVKRLRSHEKLRLERRFYRHDAVHLSARTATLVAHCERPEPAIRLSLLPGRLVAGAPELRRPDVFRRAGDAIRALHAVPYHDEDAVPLDDALESRFRAWLPRFESVAATGLPGSARAWWRRRPPLELRCRTRTHRDYSDRNWLWSEREGEPLGVIDFEQSRPDHPWTDFTRLWERDFYGRPELRDAFVEGYGASPALLTHPDFRTLAFLHSLATIAWASEVGDHEYASTGTRALASLLLDPPR